MQPLSVTDIRKAHDEIQRFYMDPDGLNRRARGIPEPVAYHDRGIEEWWAVAESVGMAHGIDAGIAEAKRQIATFPEYQEQHPDETPENPQ